MHINSQSAEFDALLALAKSVCVAARTAPKACGIDNLDTVILTGAEKDKLTAEMRSIGEAQGDKGAFFIRDADNVDAAQVIVLLGASYEVRRLGAMCQLCGFGGCTECSEAGAACVFAAMDLGIALGSAVSLAADNRADNRILFTAGKAAKNLGLLGEHTMIMGLPLCSAGKNVFFDRDPAQRITSK
jgi:uncharacterized ferredoxin-like protein